jgi:DNA-binding NarL/FixJ family response regulator
VRIILADDSQYIRTAYRRVLETQSHFEVVGVAEDGEEAVQKAKELQPDVAVLDVRMPKLNGIDAAHQILEDKPDVGIVVISAYDDMEFVRQLFQGSPTGKAYLLKTSLDDIGELIRVVEAVANGATVLDSTLVQQLVRIHLNRDNSFLLQFTETEREIWEFVAGGYENSETAATLGVTESQVSEVAGRLIDALGISNPNDVDVRSQAVAQFVNANTEVPYTVDDQQS